MIERVPTTVMGTPCRRRWVRHLRHQSLVDLHSANISKSIEDVDVRSSNSQRTRREERGYARGRREEALPPSKKRHFVQFTEPPLKGRQQTLASSLQYNACNFPTFPSCPVVLFGTSAIRPLSTQAWIRRGEGPSSFTHFPKHCQVIFPPLYPPYIERLLPISGVLFSLNGPSPFLLLPLVLHLHRRVERLDIMPSPTKTFPSPTMAFTNPPTERKRTSYTDSSSSARPTGSASSARNPAMSIHFLLNAPGSSRPPPPAPPAYRGRDPSSFVPAAPASTSHTSRKSSATPSRAVPSSRIGSGHGPPAETFVCDLCSKVFKERGNVSRFCQQSLQISSIKLLPMLRDVIMFCQQACANKENLPFFISNSWPSIKSSCTHPSLGPSSARSRTADLASLSATVSPGTTRLSIRTSESMHAQYMDAESALSSAVTPSSTSAVAMTQVRDTPNFPAQLQPTKEWHNYLNINYNWLEAFDHVCKRDFCENQCV